MLTVLIGYTLMTSLCAKGLKGSSCHVDMRVPLAVMRLTLQTFLSEALAAALPPHVGVHPPVGVVSPVAEPRYQLLRETVTSYQVHGLLSQAAETVSDDSVGNCCTVQMQGTRKVS